MPWDVHVPDEYVMSGNAAVLRCVVPAHCTDRVGATEWLTDDEISVLQYLGNCKEVIYNAILIKTLSLK